MAMSGGTYVSSTGSGSGMWNTLVNAGGKVLYYAGSGGLAGTPEGIAVAW